MATNGKEKSMKKIILLLGFIFLICNLFSQTLTFQLKNDISVQDTNLDGYYSFNQGDKFKQSNNGSGLGVESFDPLSIKICLFSKEKDKRFYLPIDNITLINNQNKIFEHILNDYWIPSYYYDLLKNNNIKNEILKYEPYLKNINYTDEGSPIPWYLYISVQRYFLGDFYFVFFGGNAYNDVDFLAYLEESSDSKIVYNVQKMYSHFFDYQYKYTSFEKNNPKFLPLYEKATPFKIIFTIDGDYMNMYIDEISENNLFHTLIRTTPEACDQIENFILGKSNDLSKVVMPNHGSNTATTVSQKIATNVVPNKVMTVSENLKLRSAEATTSTVLNVMVAGTKVKVLELGKAETIDGINSNWVKVEIISGKDRSGNIIKSGTTGWCYGGYLE